MNIPWISQTYLLSYFLTKVYPIPNMTVMDVRTNSLIRLKLDKLGHLPCNYI